MSLLLALLQAAPQPPDPPAEFEDMAAGGGGLSVRHRRRALPGWALPMLTMPLAPTPEEQAAKKAARTRRQLRTLRALKII